MILKPPRAVRGAAVLLSLVAGACVGTAAPGQVEPTALTSREITPEDLRHRVQLLSHDSLAGRGIGTPGLATAARYLAAEAARLGLEPAGDSGTYFHRVPLQRNLTTAVAELERADSSHALTADEIRPVGGVGNLPAPRPEGQGTLIFAGHLVDPEVGEAELDAEQLEGAVVIVRMASAPGLAEGAMPRMALASLFMPGSTASAVLLVAEGRAEELWGYAGERLRHGVVSRRGPLPEERGPAFFVITPAAAERLLGAPLADARKPVTGLGRVRYQVREEVAPVEAWNVAAVLPGRAGEQYVALGSHYDHIGVGEPVDGDSIYNGADDDASGTAALLEVAESMTGLAPEQRPGRSLLFVWHTAEESGLLGSEYFTDHPPVPRERIAAMVNLDMVGRNSPDSLFVVGSRRLSTTLGDWLEEANDAQALPFVLDYSYDAPDHPERVYCRSDHYSYARFGIPVAFLTSGLHEQYHRPADQAELLDYEKLGRVTMLVADLSERIASETHGPRVDQPVLPKDAGCL